MNASKDDQQQKAKQLMGAPVLDAIGFRKRGPLRLSARPWMQELVKA